MTARNLPHTAASFVGRGSEIAEITQRLNDPNCRLLTLVGPGGIGKTRLAIRIATDFDDQFDNGVGFISLQPLISPEFIVSAIADVVGFQFQPGSDLTQQLYQYLREKALLLVLDNFEHLLDGAELLTEMLAAAPNLKLLVTSREVLNLQEEWLYPVHGLPYPEQENAESLGSFSAVQLFIERARQVRKDLSLADEQAGIIRICQLVEGMPLALELASTWAKTLPTDEIASEIQRNLDFLSTSLRNVPQRHQSMQAVFEQTWRRLGEEEQRAFSALSVFSGGFRREAAAVLANVSARVLADLVDKSLLMCDPNGRYQLHELLRQYAQARLETNPQEAVRVHELHATYYLRFLHERDHGLNGGRQREAAREIEAELDNIRAAWTWAIEHSRVDSIDQAVHPLSLFYSFQSRLVEGIDTFEKAMQMLDTSDPLAEIPLAKALCELGWMYGRGSMMEKARAASERSWQIYEQHGVLPTPGIGTDPRVLLGGLSLLLLADFGVIEQMLQNVFQAHLQRQDWYNVSSVCIFLSVIPRWQGKHEAAKQYIEQGYDYAVLTDDAYTQALCLDAWGAISYTQGNLADAKRRFQSCYTIHKDFGNPIGTATALQNLGMVASNEGEHAQAHRYYEQALAIYRNVGDINHQLVALFHIGDGALAQGHYGEARHYLGESFQTTIQNQHLAYQAARYFVPVGELFLHTGRRARGLEVLTFALHHPYSDLGMKDRAQRLLERYQPTSASANESVVPTDVDWDAFAHRLLDELLNTEDQNSSGQSNEADEGLSEPLTERELEILALVADGRSNREIAEQMVFSVATVKWYLTNLFIKLAVQSRTQAVARARQLKLLT